MLHGQVGRTAQGSTVGAPGLAEAIARIETRYGTRAVVRGDVAERQAGERRISAGTSLDRVTGGGIRAGEALAFIGPATAGKLALALSVTAAAQREGGMAAWLDPSASFDPLAALRAGVDLDRLVVVRAASTEELLLAGSAVLRSEGFRLAVVDVGPSFASRCAIDDLAPLLPVVRGSPAALLVVAEQRGRHLAIPTVRVEPIGWQQRFGRTVGWSFAAGTALSSERALFAISALDAVPSDLGIRTELAEMEVAS
jgi:predicted ATP-dependent serine protease